MLKKFYLFFLFALSFPNYGQDTLINRGMLINGIDTLYLEDILNKNIYTKTDSISEDIQIFETTSITDTLLVVPGSYFSFHNSNVRKTVDINYNPNKPVTLKIPLKSIYLVKEDRAGLKVFTQPLMLLSAISALLVAPLVSIGKPFKTNRYYTVAGTSLLIFSTSLTVDLIWGHKKYYTKPHKKKKVWKIS